LNNPGSKLEMLLNPNFFEYHVGAQKISDFEAFWILYFTDYACSIGNFYANVPKCDKISKPGPLLAPSISDKGYATCFACSYS
jgi:hypothetical protein